MERKYLELVLFIIMIILPYLLLIYMMAGTIKNQRQSVSLNLDQRCNLVCFTNGVLYF